VSTKENAPLTIHQAIAAAMKDIEAIGKDRENAAQHFRFRGIDDVYNALHPIMARFGIFSVPSVVAERTEERASRNGGALIYRMLTVQYTFFAADGSSVQATVIGEGMDSGDKASNKAMAVAHKYALLQLFAIPTEDMVDPDAESHAVEPREPPQDAPPPAARDLATPDQIKRFHAAGLAACNADKAKWKAWREQVCAWASTQDGGEARTSSKELTASEISLAIEYIEKGRAQ